MHRCLQQHDQSTVWTNLCLGLAFNQLIQILERRQRKSSASEITKQLCKRFGTERKPDTLRRCSAVLKYFLCWPDLLLDVVGHLNWAQLIALCRQLNPHNKQAQPLKAAREEADKRLVDLGYQRAEGLTGAQLLERVQQLADPVSS